MLSKLDYCNGLSVSELNGSHVVVFHVGSQCDHIKPSQCCNDIDFLFLIAKNFKLSAPAYRFLNLQSPTTCPASSRPCLISDKDADYIHSASTTALVVLVTRRLSQGLFNNNNNNEDCSVFTLRYVKYLHTVIMTG